MRTGADGKAALQILNKGTLLILPQSQMSFAGAARGYFAELGSGSISFHSVSNVTNFEIRVGGFVIAPDPKIEDSAAIQRNDDGSAFVEVALGSVGVMVPGGGQGVSIKAGWQVYVSPEGAVGSVTAAGTIPAGAHSGGGTGSRTKWIALGVGGGGAATVAAILASQGGAKPISPSAP